LKNIKPSENEKKRVNSFAEKLVSVAKKVSGLDAVICGSLGKGTWLSGNHDIDIFILFPKEAPREELEKKGLEYGARVCKEMNGKAEIKYAEHPYTHAKIGGFIVDIVPCYRIHPGEKIISAVDRSPLHLEFILTNLKDELKDEALLLKQFCKGAGAYGSDAKTLGFSGYICELLILKYNSFENMLKAASEWHLPYSIDITGKAVPHHREVFIVIDPTDIHRNAAAAVSSYNIMKFIHHAKKFLRKPSPWYFLEPKIKPLAPAQIRSLKKRETYFFAMVMKKPDVIEEVLYQQARRAAARLYGMLKHNEFVALRSYEFIGREIIIMFEIEVQCLPDLKKMVGPPLFARRHVDEFLATHSSSKFNVYVEGINLVAEKSREYKTPPALIRCLMKKGSKELADSGIPNSLIEPFKSARICEGNGFFLLLSDKEFSDFLRRMYFEKIIE
ncbi:MAG: CCA tRNA nucleotidyltransferase, partial [Candidatus Aenigmarchaeota archaeon]|nr:CCA tRNA nucleotidyltransferase [Candidatus Aenigmarchaeota archaeon]MDI6722963.1 CCA tRNA nucleotidyltransferase [Candidatus Aenigmarchaeota archaeon]